MNKMTGGEILEALKELEDLGSITVADFYNYGLDIESFEYIDESLDELDEEDSARAKELLKMLGNCEVVANDSPDAEWDYYSRVVHFFPKHDVFIETKSHYTSFVGTEYGDGFGREVKPVDKVFTIYEEV